MKVKCWIVVNDNGSVYCRKNKPDLKANEVPVQIELDVPDELFERPQLQASISVPREAYMNNPINAEVRDNVKQAIEQATGLNFHVTLTHDEDESENNNN